MGGKVCRTAPDNESPLAQVTQCHPGMCGQPDYADLQGDPGGYEHCVWRALK